MEPRDPGRPSISEEPKCKSTVKLRCLARTFQDLADRTRVRSATSEAGDGSFRNNGKWQPADPVVNYSRGPTKCKSTINLCDRQGPRTCEPDPCKIRDLRDGGWKLWPQSKELICYCKLAYRACRKAKSLIVASETAERKRRRKRRPLRCVLHGSAGILFRHSVRQLLRRQSTRPDIAAILQHATPLSCLPKYIHVSIRRADRWEAKPPRLQKRTRAEMHSLKRTLQHHRKKQNRRLRPQGHPLASDQQHMLQGTRPTAPPSR